MVVRARTFQNMCTYSKKERDARPTSRRRRRPRRGSHHLGHARRNRPGESIREWYATGASAGIMGVTSAAVEAFGGLYLTRDASPLAYPLGAALAIQQLHDVGFGAWLASRSPSFLRQRPVLDVFTRYAEEVGTTVLVVDAAIVAGVVFGARTVLPRLGDAETKGVGLLASYLVFLLVHSMRPPNAPTGV